MTSIASGTASALSQYHQTSSNTASLLKAIATGKNVADAYDDGAAYAVSQSISGDVGALGAVQDSLGNAQGLTAVSVAALQGISDTTNQIQSTLTTLSDSSLSSTDRAAYTQQLNDQLQQINSFVSGASYNGTNVLASGGSTQTYVSGTNGSTVSVSYNDIGSLASTLQSSVSGASAQSAQASLQALTTFQNGVNSAAQSLSADSQSINNQIDFAQSQSDALDNANSALTDSNLGTDSTQLALNGLQQQFSVIGLSIANHQTQSVLALFKNNG